MVDVSQGGFGSLAAQEAESTAPWAQMQSPDTFQGKDGAGSVPSAESTLEIDNPDTASDVLEGNTSSDTGTESGNKYDFFSFVDEDEDDLRKKRSSSGAEIGEKDVVEDYYNTYESPLIDAMKNIMDNPTPENYDAYMKAYNSWSNDSPSAFYENIEQNEDQMGRYNEYTKDHPTVAAFQKEWGNTLWPAVKAAKAAKQEADKKANASKGVITDKDAWNEINDMLDKGEITEDQYSRVSGRLSRLYRGMPKDSMYDNPTIEIPDNTWEEWKKSMYEENFELPKEEKENTSKEAKAIVDAMSQKDFKGGKFELPVDTSAKEKGNYSIEAIPVSDKDGRQGYGVTIAAPNGEVITVGTVTFPTDSEEGVWSFRGAKSYMGHTGRIASTSEFADFITNTLRNVAISDYEDSKNFPETKTEIKDSSDKTEEEETDEDKKGVLDFLENLSKNNVRLSLLLDAIRNMTDEQLIQAGYTPDAIRVMRDAAASSGNAKDTVPEEDAAVIYNPDTTGTGGAMNVQQTGKNEEFNAGQEKLETSDENMKNIRTLYRNQPHIRRMWKNLKNDKKSDKK